jgi:hypothetical protein
MRALTASEQHIHACIAVYLNRALPEGSLHFAIDSAGKASIGIAQKLKARGGMKGTADHCLLVPSVGHALFMEIKTSIGRVSPEQEHFGNRCFAAGHYWVVVRSVEDVEATLRDLGIPLRATVSGIRASIAAQNEGLRPIRKRAVGGKRVARPTPAQIQRARSAGVLV